MLGATMDANGNHQTLAFRVLSLSGRSCKQVCRPEVTDTPEAPRAANEKLAAMGPMSRDERIMLGTMLGAVVLWVLGDKLGVPAVTAAMLGLCSLLVSGVLKWRDCLDYSAVRPKKNPKNPPLVRPHGALTPHEPARPQMYLLLRVSL